MDNRDLTKLSRWIIPGWITILSVFAFIILDILLAPMGGQRIYPSISQFIRDIPASNNEIVATLLLAGSGVPIGFSIYQIYFFLRWNSPFSKDGLFSPMIPGRENDMDKSLRLIPFNILSFNECWRKEWIKNPLFAQDHGFKWRYIELLFSEVTQKIDSCYPSVGFYQRHRYLHEVTHTLGASIGSVYIGFMSYFFIKFYKQHINLPVYLLSISLIFIIFFSLLHIEYRKKDRIFFECLRNGNKEKYDVSPITINIFNTILKINYPSIFFLLLLCAFWFFNNPLFNNSYIGKEFEVFQFVKLVIGLMFVTIWSIAKYNHNSTSDLKGDIIVLSIILILCYFSTFINWEGIVNIDWSFFAIFILFLCTNLILLSNRQNAKDDMLALEYYMIERYINEFSPAGEKK